MTGRLARAAPYALLLAVAGALYAAALRIEYIGPAERIGPDFWPRAILGLLAAVCVYEIAKSFLAAGARSTGGMLQHFLDEATGAEGEGAQRPSFARLALAVAATLGYVMLVPVLGFFLATAAYLAGFIALGGYRRWGVVAACSLGGSLATVVVFMKVVYVSLPLGMGPFRLLSIALLQVLGVR
ncbi:MAG TPA: tripartite tricarboxylate transporter TctB family protein [Burkholderiales bacterium]